MPGDRVTRPHARFEPLRHFLKQVVAHSMAKGVIDDFEAIQIHVEYGNNDLMALRIGYCLSDAIFEEVTIRKPGQAVIVGERVDFLLCLLSFGDVMDRCCHTHYTINIIAHRLRQTFND